MGSTVCPPSTFRDNVKTNLARGLEEVGPRPDRGEPLHIACAGPSLRDTVEQLRGQKTIWALNAAHDYLISQGIVPTHGIAQAPEHQILDTFKSVRPDVVYAFASCTHPDLVDRALSSGARVALWNAAAPDEWELDYGDRAQVGFVYGGGTIGLRVLDMAHMVGFRDLHIHGFDASLSMDLRIGPDKPIYEDRRKDIRLFELRGKFFPSLPAHARQVEEIQSVLRPLAGLRITWYGDGLMQWAMKGAA